MMRALSKWFLKCQEYNKRFVSIYDMIFEGNYLAYILYRLRLFNLRILFKFSLHTAYFYVLFDYLPSRSFNNIVLASALKSLISTAWWGSLETLRTQNQYFYRAGDKDEINKNSGFWLLFSFLISGGIGLISVCLFFLFYLNDTANNFNTNEFSKIDILCISSIILVLIIQIPIQTFYSGIYAINRIFRPGSSILLGDLVGLGILFFFWPLIHLFAVPLAITLRELVSNYLSFHYTREMYSLYDLTPIKPCYKTFLNRFFQIPWKMTFLSSTANIFMMIDSFLLLLLYFANLEDPTILSLYYMIFLIAPIFRTTSHWARLFYFDRKQLDDDAYARFMQQYDRYLEKSSSIIGFFCWTMASISSYLLISEEAFIYNLLLLPLFLLRSRIANRQIKCFSNCYYYDIIVSGFFLTGSLAGMILLNLELTIKFLLIVLTVLIVHEFLNHFRLPRYSKIKFIKPHTNLYAWLTHLVQTTDLVDVYQIQLHPTTKFQQLFYLMRKIAEKLSDKDSHICLLHSFCLLFFKKHSHKNELSHSEMIKLGAGLIKKIEHNLVSQDLKEPQVHSSISTAQNCPIVLSIIQNAECHSFFKEKESHSIHILLKNFHQKFPEGIYYDPMRKMGPKAQLFPLEAVRKYSILIEEYLYSVLKKTKIHFNLSVLYLNPVIHTIFVIPRSYHKKNAIKEWNRYLHAINLANAIYPIKEDNFHEENKV